jgi:hypothetical protein
MVEFPDDPAVGDSVQLLRRIPPLHFVRDENSAGGRRPSSAAFDDDTDGQPMSVYRRDVIDVEGGDISRVMVGHDGYALAGLTAGHFRMRDQTVHPDPLPNESAHTVICGVKTESTRRFFRKNSVWVIPPPAVASADTR